MLLDVKTSLVSSENMKCKLHLSKSSKEASQKNTHYVMIIALKYLSKYGFLASCWMEQKTKKQTNKHKENHTVQMFKSFTNNFSRCAVTQSLHKNEIFH